jgi:hypothetical protein
MTALATMFSAGYLVRDRAINTDNFRTYPTIGLNGYLQDSLGPSFLAHWVRREFHVSGAFCSKVEPAQLQKSARY